MPESLHRPGIDNFSFFGLEQYKRVDRIADFVMPFVHLVAPQTVCAL